MTELEQADAERRLRDDTIVRAIVGQAQREARADLAATTRDRVAILIDYYANKRVLTHDGLLMDLRDLLDSLDDTLLDVAEG